MWFERERKKKSCVVVPPTTTPLLFNPNYFSSNYPAGVYTFFSRTLWPCCGRSELWPHYRSCLPPAPPQTHSLSTVAPIKIVVTQSGWTDMFTVKLETYCSSLSRCESTKAQPEASGLQPLVAPTGSSGWFPLWAAWSTTSSSSEILWLQKKTELQAKLIDSCWHQDCHWFVSN